MRAATARLPAEYTWQPFLNSAMNVYDAALEHVKNSIGTADVLGLKSCAILVSDLKLLLEMLEDALRNQQGGTQQNAQ